ncbi:MAG: hypothetical protein AAFX87_17585 [Bacteroidota bacterium]
MSGKDIDNLFRDKLEDFGKSPSSAAWSKLEGKLPGKRKKAIWPFLSIAASIAILLCSVAIVYWPQQENEGQEIETIAYTDDQPAKQENQPEKNEAIAEAKDTEEQVSNQDEEEATELTQGQPENKEQVVVKEEVDGDKASKRIESKQTKKIELKKLPNESAVIENSVAVNEVKQEDKVVEESKQIDKVKALELPPVEEAVAVNENEPAKVNEQDNSQQTQGVKIVFNLGELPQSEALAANDSEESEEQKGSALKKVLSFAKDVKNGDGKLGNLRRAKNQLFAFGGKKKESRNAP